MGDFLREIGITLAEINGLLEEVSKQETSILRIKPQDIDKLGSYVERQKKHKNYEIMRKIYVLPLIEMANRVSNYTKKGDFHIDNLDNLSIMGQIMKIRNYLVNHGVMLDNIMNVIPQSEDDVEVLYAAAERGFDLNIKNAENLSNSERVERASAYLQIFVHQNKTM